MEHVDSDTHAESRRRTTAALGTVCLLAGFFLAGIVLTVRFDTGWGRFGSVVGRNPVLSWGIALGFMVGGVLLLKQASPVEPLWSPGRPGRRFRRAVLYTRPDCPLCDEARQTLASYQHVLPPVETVNIEVQPAEHEHLRTCVPALELDGRVRFRGHINEVLLRRLIEGTAPSCSA